MLLGVQKVSSPHSLLTPLAPGHLKRRMTLTASPRCRLRCLRACVLLPPALRSSLLAQARVGELLLKHEEAELHRVTEASQELLAREEDAVAIAPLPCGAEAEACRSCYAACSGEPLACAEHVRAFVQCAERAG